MQSKNPLATEERGYEWKCLGCPRVFAPRLLRGIKRYERYCPACQTQNLLILIFAPDEEDQAETENPQTPG